MKKLKACNLVDKATALLLGGMFVSMSLAAVTVAVSAALNII